ncbi:ABC di/oligopeptide transporter inner membrane subunit [Actinomadura sp. NBRC 104412]|uniref:ABC transporter permease n=1 Tax=Actinomadura sp. NBRC 104412 TaxID=3032203 RepID=UPI0024A3DF59|nr:ABC transporter permease [Actinomadura sp. NBRC 104412]GLZ06230.1 ABC di/oligopeptide transporter inner membrane subunit [Actinomadura sp. NBRC 104412]
MIEYALRRLGYGVMVILLVTVLVFLLMRLLPGDVVAILMQNGANVTAEQARRMEAEFGLDDPVWVQFTDWLAHAVRGDLGRSFYTDEPVTGMFAERVPVTLELTLLSFAVATVVGIAFGVVSAVKRGRSVDAAVRITAVAGLSVPNFVVATLFLTFFALWFSWSPPLVYKGPTEDLRSHLEQMAMPAIALGIASLAGLTRLTRSAMLEALGSNFIRAVRARGVRESVVHVKHALRNASIPVLTLVGGYLATILGGTVILESMFSIDGTGQLLYKAVQQRDYPVVVSCTIFYAAVYVFVIVLVDLMYAVLDPRIRYGRSKA